MPLFAVLLVVIAAFNHASWNIHAKRAVDCRHFDWYYSAGSVVLWMPLAAFALYDFRRCSRSRRCSPPASCMRSTRRR